MKRLTILVACLTVAVCAFSLEALPQGEVEEVPLTWKQVALGDGEALYLELCAVCHGVDATGKGPAAPALSTPIPDLTRLALNKEGVFPFAEVEKAIAGEVQILAHGTRDMPMWGDAFREVRPDRKPSHREGFARLRIHNLTRYLETLQVE